MRNIKQFNDRTGRNTYIAKQLILSQLNEQYVFQYYFPYKIVLKKNIYRSPFRVDKSTGSCHFAWYNGRFYLFDKACGTNYDVFDYLSIKYNLSLFQVLNKIDSDFNLGLSSKNKKEKIDNRRDDLIKLAKENKNSKETKRYYKVICKDYSEYELAYWNQYGITRNTLDKYNVNSVDNLFISTAYDYKHIYSHSKEDLCFLYTLPPYNGESASIQVYRPLNREYKWSESTTEDNICLGYHSLDRKYNTLVIASSMKDAMCFNEMGYDSCAPSAESSYINRNIIGEFKLLYDNIYVVFDNDKQGIRLSNIMSSVYDVDNVILPSFCMGKDVSDMISFSNFQYIKEKVHGLLK